MAEKNAATGWMSRRATAKLGLALMLLVVVGELRRSCEFVKSLSFELVSNLRLFLPNRT